MIDQVKSYKDLAEFVEALRADLLTNSSEWENPTLERYLEAMSAFISALEFYHKNTDQPFFDKPTWKTLADILYTAKVYE